MKKPEAETLRSLPEMFFRRSARYGDKPRYRVFREGTWQEFTWRDMETAVREHGTIVAALRARDADQASVLMGDHVRNGAVALAVFGKQPAA